MVYDHTDTITNVTKSVGGVTLVMWLLLLLLLLRMYDNVCLVISNYPPRRYSIVPVASVASFALTGHSHRFRAGSVTQPPADNRMHKHHLHLRGRLRGRVTTSAIRLPHIVRDRMCDEALYSEHRRRSHSMHAPQMRNILRK